MMKMVKRGVIVSLLTLMLLVISQVSVLAQATITNATDTSMTGIKVVLFFILLLVVILAPAFKKSVHRTH